MESDSIREYLAREIFFRGRERNLAISRVRYESNTPTGIPAIPIYSVTLLDAVLAEVIGEGIIQIAVTDPPHYYELYPLVENPSEEHIALISQIYKLVTEHHNRQNFQTS